MFGCGIGGLGKKFGFRKQKSKKLSSFERFDTERLSESSYCSQYRPEDDPVAWIADDQPPTKETFKRGYSMRDELPPITINPNEVSFGRTLGKGISGKTFQNVSKQRLFHKGTVYRGRLGCEDVAIKIVRPRESVFQVGTEPLELYMGQSVNHPNLVKVLGVYLGGDRETDGSNFSLDPEVTIYDSPHCDHRTSSSLFSDMAQDLSEGPEEIWIIMEYCNKGSLRDAIREGEFFEDKDRQKPRILHILFAALEVAAALEHLHAFGIIHGDLKSQNVMLTTSQILAKSFVCKVKQKRCFLSFLTEMDVQVGDFGMSRPAAQFQTHISTFTAGTVSHMSPEVLKDGILTPAVDVFSFGILLWELMSGQLPFQGTVFQWQKREDCFRPGMNSGEMMVSIVEGHRPKIPKFCPSMLADLIRRCWNPQREMRPTFKEITRMLKTMLGGPPLATNKGIPAISNPDLQSTAPTLSTDLCLSEGDTTLCGTMTDMSDNGLCPERVFQNQKEPLSGLGEKKSVFTQTPEANPEPTRIPKPPRIPVVNFSLYSSSEFIL